MKEADVPLIEDALYAVLHGPEWHLAYWRMGAFEVIDNWGSGDRWIPAWVQRVVLVEAPDESEST